MLSSKIYNNNNSAFKLNVARRTISIRWISLPPTAHFGVRITWGQNQSFRQLRDHTTCSIASSSTKPRISFSWSSGISEWLVLGADKSNYSVSVKTSFIDFHIEKHKKKNSRITGASNRLWVLIYLNLIFEFGALDETIERCLKKESQKTAMKQSLRLSES